MKLDVKTGYYLNRDDLSTDGLNNRAINTEGDECKSILITCETCGETACATVNACKTLKNCDTIMNECPINTKGDRCQPYSRYGTECCVTVGVMECEQSIEVCPLTEDGLCVDTLECSGFDDCESEFYCYATKDDSCICQQPIE